VHGAEPPLFFKDHCGGVVSDVAGLPLAVRGQPGGMRSNGLPPEHTVERRLARVVTAVLLVELVVVALLILFR
jgi:hypothetical protein